ncbi:MAG: GUN4 domain-containing protein, partial [Dolichospermum sp.]
SNGKFGFSVQKQIWLESGGKLRTVLNQPDWDTFVRLVARVGWRQNGEWLSYNSYTFSTNAPSGHLPVGVGVGVGGWELDGWLFSLL